jgi:hypothetical protein
MSWNQTGITIMANKQALKGAIKSEVQEKRQRII